LQGGFSLPGIAVIDEPQQYVYRKVLAQPALFRRLPSNSPQMPARGVFAAITDHNSSTGKGGSNMARITVEDTLQKINNRFVIAQMAMKRVRMYREGYPSLVQTDNKEVVAALREIAAGKVVLQAPIQEAGIKVE
jgi:DNA-directed RNA polymerase subunit omega